MGVTQTTALRNVQADATDAYINTGAGTAVVRCREDSDTVIDFPLQNPAFGDADEGVITLNGVPITANAAAEGVANNGLLVNRNGDPGLAFSITATGMGGDLTFDNPSLAETQEAKLSSMAYAAAP